MKAKLIKQNFTTKTYNTYGYKIKEVKYCCNDLKENPLFEWSTEHTDKNGVPIPSIRHDREETEWGDTYVWSDYYSISFCPFCGETIEIEVVEEENVTELYKKIETERESVNEKWRKTDSKKKEAQFLKIRNQLDRLIDYFHELNNYRNNEEILEEFTSLMEK